jgi:hypothetical protein
VDLDIPPLRLSSLDIQLPPQAGVARLDRFHELELSLQQQVIQGGQSSRALSDRMVEFERRLARGRVAAESLLREPRDIRVLVTWWRSSPAVNLARLPLTRPLLHRCIALRPRFSLQALFGLINLYFEVFDQLSELDELAQVLQQQLNLRGQDGAGHGSLAPMIRNRHHLFRVDGPAQVVAMARSGDRTLDTVADELGIPDEFRGRFYECCQQRYYLETLNGLEVGQDDPILSELARFSVHGARFREGLLLGHEVIRRIVDKASSHAQLPDNWLHLILTIAGDPRVSVGSARFTKWWARLDPGYTKRVRRWLSRMDLGLFLEVLEDYSNQVGGEMRRMFPARERFLRGLFEAELIHDSRLFLSRRADQFVRTNYQNREVPAYAINSDAERSVFYLNIGGMHVFEGSHNFYFWIYRDLPRNNPSENYRSSIFPIRELGMGLMERVIRGKGERPFHVAHNGDWQHAVIAEFRRLGITIDPASVLTEDDYRVYRRRYGVS